MSEVNNQWVSVRDHRRSFAQYAYVYPVISRRSRGLSIGINLNPDKICNFDCAYCEVDRKLPGRPGPVDAVQLRAELDALVQDVRNGGLAQQPRFQDNLELLNDIKDLAFSGDGEPTMIANFAECVQVAADVRAHWKLTGTKIVLITNAAGLDKTDVQRGLAIMDAHQGEIWGKLDAGTDSYYRLVNRTFIRFDRILNNLLLIARLRPIVVQSLFFRVRGEVMSEAEQMAYCGRLRTLCEQGGRIKEVHAYTIARPTPEPWATALTEKELEAIGARIRQQTGLTVHCFP
jgi:wyosine [tRNA(Phe)-imidazoG37] synthetase (radical SAM superfamily)